MSLSPEASEKLRILVRVVYVYVGTRVKQSQLQVLRLKFNNNLIMTVKYGGIRKWAL